MTYLRRYEKLQADKRKNEAEIAAAIKQIAVEREDARRKVADERQKVEDEKEVARRKLALERNKLRQEAEAFEEERERIKDQVSASSVIPYLCEYTFTERSPKILETTYLLQYQYTTCTSHYFFATGPGVGGYH